MVDAFPVEVVRNKGGEHRQKSVDYQNGRFVPVWEELSPEVAAYMEKFGVQITDGHEIAVNLKAVEWLSNLGRLTTKGAIAIIDYGNYGPTEFATDTRGAIRTFPRQYGPLEVPGQIDLTSDVDFKVLEQVGRESGMNVAFNGRQNDLLTACGVPTVAELDSIAYPDNLPDDMYIRVGTTYWLRSRNFRALVLTTAGIELDLSTLGPLLPAYQNIISR